MWHRESIGWTLTLAAVLWAAASSPSSAAVMAVIRTPWVFQDGTPDLIQFPTPDMLAGWDNTPSLPQNQRDRRMKIDLDGDGVHELEFYGKSSGLAVLISSHAEILSSRIPPTNGDNSTYVIPLFRRDLLGPDTLDRYQYQGLPPTLWYGSDAREDHVLGIGFGSGLDPAGAYFPGQIHPPYVAIRFKRNGEWHYGWVQVTSWLDSMGQINGWAYESEANTPILIGVIPEPSVLLLAACSTGLMWRRRRACG
jgi:hypothetical protein